MPRVRTKIKLEPHQTDKIWEVLNVEGTCGCGEHMTHQRALMAQPVAKRESLEIIGLCVTCYNKIAAVLREIVKEEHHAGDE